MYHVYMDIFTAFKIIPLIDRQVPHKVGRKRKITEKNISGYPQAELGLSHICTDGGSNFKRLDDQAAPPSHKALVFTESN